MSIINSVDSWPRVWGVRVELIIDPTTDPPTVRTDYFLGSGTSIDVWTNRALSVATVPDSAVPESVEEWVADHAKDFVALAAEYKGDHWNGGNHIGTWAEDAETLRADLAEWLDVACGDGTVASYWDAYDYLSGDIPEVLSDALADDCLDSSVEREVAAALDHGAHLDADEVRRVLEGLLAEHRADLDDPVVVAHRC